MINGYDMIMTINVFLKENKNMFVRSIFILQSCLYCVEQNRFNKNIFSINDFEQGKSNSCGTGKCQGQFWLSEVALECENQRVIIPPETKFRGGILDSPCSSVRPSVRPSVCLSVCLSVRPWVGVRVITLILFSGFEKFLVDISLGSRSCMGLNISVLPH